MLGSPVSRTGGSSPTTLRFFEEEHASFHEHGTFFAIWLLVMFVAVEIMTKARAILEPILWAFFLMMGLVPLTDVIERGLNRILGACNGRKKLPGRKSPRIRSREDPGVDATQPALPGPRPPRESPRSPCEDIDGPSSEGEATLSSEESNPDQEDGGGCCCDQGNCARTVAVLMVIVFSLSCASLFFIMVYKSAIHMQDSWPHYERGARLITTRIEAWMDKLPDDLLQKYTNKALSSMEEALSTLVGGLLEATTHTAVEILWVLLYMIFWLCQPFHVGKDVSAVFRRYIFLKGIASGGYAFCVWVLLHCIGVDLAIVFGLITFVFNFIPEVGPFMAMLLPLPVILFDDRMQRPLVNMFGALLGQLSLKVVFGNIVEIKLIESQQEMRMHPVVILFFVAFFQFIWGATGMLLSVPIMAALKATLHKIPPAYRNPILIFLEGDKTAPARWERWRNKLRRGSAEESESV